MALILGIDSAWTESGSSGVALLKVDQGKGRILAVEPSYAAFINRGSGETPTRQPITGLAVDVSELLQAGTLLGGEAMSVVAIDMPMSLKNITGRRTADNAISQKFGAAGAGTHSPNENRPGAHGKRLADAFQDAGFRLATNNSSPTTLPALIEVFPLAALVCLMRLDKRPRYKVGKRQRYWPEHSSADRIALLLTEWHRICAALRDEINDLAFDVPDVDKVESASSLKAYEDMLDAIVCAWVGWRFYVGTAEPFGDADAAIWLPTPK